VLGAGAAWMLAQRVSGLFGITARAPQNLERFMGFGPSGGRPAEASLSSSFDLPS
jgi:hypothetical protein